MTWSPFRSAAVVVAGLVLLLLTGLPSRSLARNACGGCGPGRVCVRTHEGPQCLRPEPDSDDDFDRGESHWRGGGLGSVWTESESGWSGTWTRRPGTNEFDALWVHPSGQRERASLRITIRGDSVSIERRQRRGECTYDGTLSRDGRSVRGSYECDWSGGRVPFSATIH